MREMRGKILDEAQELVQTLGFDGFSFADLAERVGIRKASIHHHFPTKVDLAVILVGRFRAECSARLAILSEDPDPRARLAGYVAMFRSTLEAGRMCLCGILAAGIGGLPGPLVEAVRSALDDQEAWLASTFREGRDRGLIRPSGTPEDQARSLLGSLEGALLLARARDDVASFDVTARGLLESLDPGPPGC